MAELEELIDDLIYSARTGDMDEMRESLAAGAPVDGRDANGTTALMMAAANGHVEAMQVLLSSGADINATNERENTSMHWAVFTGQEEAVKTLLAAGCDLLARNQQGLTAAMDAERAGKGELVVLILNSLDDEDAAAAVLGIEEEKEAEGAEGEKEKVERVAPQEGVDKRLDGHELKAMQQAPAGGEALPATRGVLSGETWEGKRDGPAAPEQEAQEGRLARLALSDEQRAGPTGAEQAEQAEATAGAPALAALERPLDNPAVAQRVAEAGAARTGDWRYSVLPAAVPAEKMLQFSRDFFSTTGLLKEDGNTFGPEFEQHYVGHKNYFYYMNRNQVVAGAEKAGFIFEELDAHTRQVVELHHPGVPLRLERAFGAYYEGERDGFHLGVNEHCDGGSNLVSTIVHAMMPDGDVGFSEGGELMVSETDGLPAKPIVHTNDTVGDVVYLGTGVFHHAKPIKQGGRRLVFCMFYAAEAGSDLSKHAFA